jgi:dipeptidyl aminopeptidase/acylaminoacyl peptidase
MPWSDVPSLVYDIERYLNIRSAYGASLSEAGTLAFLMDTTGTAQIWTLDVPRGWPEQRTFYDESVSFCTFSPEREELAFGMDEGGDERTQLYRLDLAGERNGQVTPLTDMPDAKHLWGGWSHDGERFAFASNRRDEAVFDVYVQGRDETGADADLVYESDGWYTPGGFSPDDARLIVTRATSLLDQDVYVLDLDSGELDHLTPHDGYVRYGSATWAPDGEHLYVTTDRDSDSLACYRLGLDGSAERVSLPDDEENGDWNADGIAVDDETGRVVYSRNVDGYTELRAGDLSDDGLAVEDATEVDLPPGVAGGVSFDGDAERFAFTATASTRNTNVHLADAATGGTERWTLASTAGVPQSTFVEPELVRFESFDGREIPAFFSLPPEVPEGGVPVIVDIHGGPESQRRPTFNPLKQFFLQAGYAVFEPNVRGSTGYGKAYSHLDDVEKRMDSVKDVEAATDWLAAHESVDADRLVAYGGSYGGFMVLAAMTEYPDRWAAGVDVVGIANFVTFLENTGEWRRELREAEYGSLAEDREFLESISPINNIDAIGAPLFVIHGANDPRVPLGEAEQVAEEAAEHVPVETLIFEDEGHGLSKLENRIEAYPAVVSFLDDHV